MTSDFTGFSFLQAVLHPVSDIRRGYGLGGEASPDIRRGYGLGDAATPGASTHGAGAAMLHTTAADHVLPLALGQS